MVSQSYESGRGVYTAALRVTGGVAFLLACGLVSVGLTLPVPQLGLTTLALPTMTPRSGTIWQLVEQATFAWRTISSGILYGVASLMIYPPFTNRLLAAWDNLTPAEPDLPNPLALFTNDGTTFFVIERQLPPTGLIFALFATATFLGIPLL